MKKQTVYKQDIIDNLKTEISKFKDEKKKELTLDKILAYAKNDAVALIELNCTAQEIAAIFNNAGIQVSVNKIKQLYCTTAARNKPKLSNKINQSEKE